MKKKMQDSIVHALSVITKVGMLEKGKLPNEYKGYISSYGAAVGQSGLLPATMFFSEKPAQNPKLTDTKLRRTKLMRAIYAVLKKEGEPSTNEHVLLNYAKLNYTNRTEIQNILNAAVALKMAMRAYSSDTDTPSVNNQSESQNQS
jgi:CRISPR-associated protein (Cas_Cmr5)